MIHRMKKKNTSIIDDLWTKLLLFFSFSASDWFTDINPYNEKEVFDLKNSPTFEVNVKSPKYPSTEKEDPLVFSIDTSFEIEESSFVSNVTTEDTTKNQDTSEDKEITQNPKDKNENNSLNKIFFNKNTDDSNNSNNDKHKKGGNKSVNSCLKASALPFYLFGKSGRFSGSRASHMLRNWITCGTANTDEKAVVAINKRKGGRTSTVTSVSENNFGQISKEQKYKGYEKSFDGINGSKKSKKEESNNIKTSRAANHKPINGPNCS